MVDGRNLERGAGPPDDDHLGDDVVGLVLGDLDADRRTALATHLLRCAPCRREYDELATTVADLLPAVPGVQPPLGFDERVLARLAAVGRTGRARPSPRRWRWVAVAAAVLVAVLVPLGVWAVVSGDGTDRSPGDLATLRLTRDGSPVGTVSVTDVDDGAVAVVALVDAPDDVSYFCRMHLADGSTVDSEAWPAGGRRVDRAAPDRRRHHRRGPRPPAPTGSGPPPSSPDRSSVRVFRCDPSVSCGRPPGTKHSNARSTRMGGAAT